MVITFCGHSNAILSIKEIEQLKTLLLHAIMKKPTCKFYLGGYGDFDNLCLKILKKLKTVFPDIEIIFITPYLDEKYSKLTFAKENYDNILFPPIEHIPRKFSITKRNEWMVTQSDLVIAFVKHSWGGAAKTLEYAKRQKIPFYNLFKSD